MVFLVSVPIGLFGTIWAYLMLRGTAPLQGQQSTDWVGNIAFALGLPAANQAHLLGKVFFPMLISSPFLVGIRAVFYLSVALCVIAAVASLLRGKRYIHGQQAIQGEANAADAAENRGQISVSSQTKR